MDETRRRIVQAAVDLHTSVGPLATTISGIADRAGVERLTVYRHFPDEPSLLAACTEHFYRLNPPPRPEAWREIEDPVGRLEQALTEVYAYRRRTAAATANILRDAEVAPDRFGMGFRRFATEAEQVLMRGWPARGRARERTHAAIAHAIDFHTWRSLVQEQGLSKEEAVHLMVRLVQVAARG